MVEVTRAFARLVIAAGLVMVTGCASVTQGSNQSLKVETLSKEGVTVGGAECRLSNDKGTSTVRSGETTLVRRSGGNLSVECHLAGQPPAFGQAVSRVNAGMVGNVLIGGAIGAAIDVGTGAGYTYPTWLQLVFGEERLYDRSGNRSDDPTAGTVVRANVQETAATIRRSDLLPPPETIPSTQIATTATASFPAGSGPQGTPRELPKSQPLVTSPIGGAAMSSSQAVAAAVPAPIEPLRRGDTLEYMLVDKLTGTRTAVLYRLDRVEKDRLVFN